MIPMLFEKDLVFYQLNLMLSANQGLPLFRQTQTQKRHKSLQKHNNEMWLMLGWFLWKL